MDHVYPILTVCGMISRFQDSIRPTRNQVFMIVQGKVTLFALLSQQAIIFSPAKTWFLQAGQVLNQLIIKADVGINPASAYYLPAI